MDVTPRDWFCENCGSRQDGIAGKMPDGWRWVEISPTEGGSYHCGAVTCKACVASVYVALCKRTEMTGYEAKSPLT